MTIIKPIDSAYIQRMWDRGLPSKQIISILAEQGTIPAAIAVSFANLFGVNLEAFCNVIQLSDIVISELTVDFLQERFEHFAEQRPNKLNLGAFQRRQMPHSMNSELDAEFIQNTLRETRAMGLGPALRVMVDNGFSASQISLEIQLRDEGILRKVVAVKDLGFSLIDARMFVECGDRALSDDEVTEFDALLFKCRNS